MEELFGVVSAVVSWVFGARYAPSPIGVLVFVCFLVYAGFAYVTGKWK